MSSERAPKSGEELLAGLAGGDLELEERKIAGQTLAATEGNRHFYDRLLADRKSLAALPACPQSAEVLARDLAEVREGVLGEAFGEQTEVPATHDPPRYARTWLIAAALATLLAASWMAWRIVSPPTVGENAPVNGAEERLATAATPPALPATNGDEAQPPETVHTEPSPATTPPEPPSPVVVAGPSGAAAAEPPFDLPIPANRTRGEPHLPGPPSGAVVVWTDSGKAEEPELIIHWLIDDVASD